MRQRTRKIFRRNPAHGPRNLNKVCRFDLRTWKCSVSFFRNGKKLRLEASGARANPSTFWPEGLLSAFGVLAGIDRRKNGP